MKPEWLEDLKESEVLELEELVLADYDQLLIDQEDARLMWKNCIE